MLKKILSYFTLPLLLFLSNSSGDSAPHSSRKGVEGQTGTLEKLIVASGNVAMDLDLNRLNGRGSDAQEPKRDAFHFSVGPNSFFTILVFNNILRGPEAGSMGLIWGNSKVLPEPLNASSNQLIIEKNASSERFTLVVRDGKTGFVFFDIEGHLYEYEAAGQLLRIEGGRLLISAELANKLGRPADAGLVVGEISITTTTYPIEITTVVNGAAQSSVLPARRSGARDVPDAVPGPDIIVGDLPDMEQFGAGGSQVGLGLATTSCNNGNVEVDWFELPDTNHNVIPQNLYRMSGGANNNERFEQIGQSWMKHALFAIQQNSCGFGCTPAANGQHLGVGCSDPYDAGLNADQDFLGSRAWVNPFTGVFPSNSATHAGHVHTGQSHRIIVELDDLNTTMNPGATYYAEAQYVNPQEYNWCQSHPGQCNMYNNASYRRFNVSGTTSFTFSPISSTVRMTPAINAWPGATINTIEPVQGVDGRAFIACKVTNPSVGVWHYEYAIYNQNLDRGIQSFSVPLFCGTTASNLGFHAPPNHPGWANDGTQGDAGYSNAAWTPNQTTSAVSWSSETFAQNQNANALRWGTLYNFRFDADSAPTTIGATIGFFKTGAPIILAVPGPGPISCGGSPTPTPSPSPTATPTPPATPAPSGTPTPTPPCGDPVEVIADGSFENGGIPSTIWNDPQSSNNFGTPLCDFASCGNGGGASPPRTGLIWARFGGVAAQESATLGQDVTIPSAPFATLRFWMRIGIVSSPFTDVLNVRVDGEIVARYPEPAVAESDYTMRTISLNAFANGATHNIEFEYLGPSSGIGSYVVDDVSLLIQAGCPTPPPTPTPSATPPLTPTPTPTLSPGITPSPTPAAQANNLSTRMRVQTGDNVGIGGFIITGSAPKHVLLRAIGPSLSQFGVPNALADPVLELHGSGAFVTITNDNWMDDPVQKVAILATGLAPTNNLESAIDATLNPGAYTAVVRGKNNTSGIALVEVYDLSQAVMAKLANISTRALVGIGDDIVIAGFILGSHSGADRIVVRGIGPSLTAFGVANALVNPTLELRDSNGALLVMNNDWQDSPAQAAELTAAGLAPTNPLESGIAATLPPGLYTALLAGLNNGTGVGLVEVYDRGGTP